MENAATCSTYMSRWGPRHQIPHLAGPAATWIRVKDCTVFDITTLPSALDMDVIFKLRAKVTQSDQQLVTQIYPSIHQCPALHAGSG
jgi:hypothetical protein